MSKLFISWAHDLDTLLLPNGFELGFTGQSAWKTDCSGLLWAVTAIERGPRQYETLWYAYRNSLDSPSESVGRMSRETFNQLFANEGGVL